MGYEGLDDSRDVANEEKKRPWEIFPEDDSASAKDSGDKKHVKTKEQERANREKRRAKINSLKIWISKNRILSVGIILAIIALIIGLVFLIINLTKPSESTQENNNLEEIEQLRIPDNFTVEETQTADYAYTIIRMQLSEVIKEAPEDEDGRKDTAKVEDLINSYIEENVKNEADKSAYELVKIIYLINADIYRADQLFEEFDNKNITLGKKTRYIYILAKTIFYKEIENLEEEAKWQDLLQKEYLNSTEYIDMETYETTGDGHSGGYESTEASSEKKEGE